MDTYIRRNSGQQWLDEVESYANGRPERDPEIADYLKGLSNGLSPLRVRSVTKEVIYMDVTMAGSLHHGPDVLQHITADVPRNVILTPLSRRTSKQSSPVSTVHRWIWLFLVVFSSIWGVLAGASIVGDIGIDRGFALYGVLGNMVLALSLHRLGRARSWADR